VVFGIGSLEKLHIIILAKCEYVHHMIHNLPYFISNFFQGVAKATAWNSLSSLLQKFSGIHMFRAGGKTVNLF